jgi:hypothetical protein
MSKEAADRLAGALKALPFVEPIRQDFVEVTRIKLLCRVSKGAEAQWAKVVEKMLRAADSSGFQVHICRLYFLHNDNMVYGWHVGVDAQSMFDAVDSLLRGLPVRQQEAPPRKQPNPAANLASMGAYSPPLGADDKGNPIVPRQLESMPFTGMEGRKDRNVPTGPGEDGRGGGKGIRKIGGV